MATVSCTWIKETWIIISHLSLSLSLSQSRRCIVDALWKLLSSYFVAFYLSAPRAMNSEKSEEEEEKDEKEKMGGEMRIFLIFRFGEDWAAGALEACSHETQESRFTNSNLIGFRLADWMEAERRKGRWIRHVVALCRSRSSSSWIIKLHEWRHPPCELALEPSHQNTTGICSLQTISACTLEKRALWPLSVNINV